MKKLFARVFLAIGILLFVFLVPLASVEYKYQKAISYYESGDYVSAQIYFNDLGHYRETDKYVEQLK